MVVVCNGGYLHVYIYTTNTLASLLIKYVTTQTIHQHIIIRHTISMYVPHITYKCTQLSIWANCLLFAVSEIHHTVDLCPCWSCYSPSTSPLSPKYMLLSGAPSKLILICVAILNKLLKTQNLGSTTEVHYHCNNLPCPSINWWPI